MNTQKCFWCSTIRPAIEKYNKEGRSAVRCRSCKCGGVKNE